MFNCNSKGGMFIKEQDLFYLSLGKMYIQRKLGVLKTSIDYWDIDEFLKKASRTRLCSRDDVQFAISLINEYYAEVLRSGELKFIHTDISLEKQFEIAEARRNGAKMQDLMLIFPYYSYIDIERVLFTFNVMV